MYEAFYGFKEKPFSMLPDPGFLYLSKKHQAALTLLEYGLLNHVGFCVISGEAGAGKTTILRALLERIGDDITVGLITNTHQSFGGLLDWVLSSFDLHRPNLTHVEMHQVFMAFLIEEYAKGHTVLLIVDEAQNMKPDTLEELRMLSNVNSAKDQLMQVVLSGQPALKETLRRPDLMQFAQRIAVDYHIESLNLKETCGYIQHRLITAGAEKDIFTPAACERIHNYSGGTPRLINLLCETVLVYGFADQQDVIDVDLVDEMVLERMKDSVVPIVNREIAKQDNAEASRELEKDFPWISPKKGAEDSIEEPVKSAVQKTEDSTEKSQAKISDEKIIGLKHFEQKPVEKKENEQDKEKKTKVEQDKAEQVKSKKDKAEKKKPKETKSGESTKAVTAKISNIEDDIRSNKKKDKTPGINANETRKQMLKYGLISAVISVLLIVSASMLVDDKAIVEQEVVIKEIQPAQSQEALLKREKEEKLLRELQIQTETLKKERDAAIAKAEEEKKAKQLAEKQAVEKVKAAATAAAAARTATKAVEKAITEKRRLEEKKRIAAVKAREHKAKAAEAKAQKKNERVKRETAKLEAERREMKVRLEEERRLSEQAAVRRLELEKAEILRLQLQVAKNIAAAKEAAAAAAEAKNKRSVECTGPTARFKAGCR
jgi:general secretion pathway protein A